MDYVTGGVEWAPMPDIFERFIYPDFTFDVPSDPKRYLAKLQEAFPGMLVETILLNKAGQAIGVRASNTLRSRSAEQFFAPVIISCAGAKNTYLKLLPEGARPALVDELERIEPSLSWACARAWPVLAIGARIIGCSALTITMPRPPANRERAATTYPSPRSKIH